MRANRLQAVGGRLPGAPEHLSGRSQALWRSTVADYDLEPHSLELLRLALEALDRCEQAREEIAAHGAYVSDRYGGRRASPAIAVERDARIAAARLFRELDLEGAAIPDPRPPRRR